LKKSILNKKDFSYILEKKSNVVITGDSLAYNKYDFITGPRSNAWDCYPGMKSWSFLLRDYIILNQKGFIAGRNIEFEKEVQYKFFSQSKFDCLIPFIYKGICIELNKSEKLKINNANGYLHILTEPKCGGYIEVDGIEYSIEGDINRFKGYNILVIPMTEGNIVCKDKEVRLNIIGISNVGTQIFLTGSGSKTTKWLYDNLEDRVLKYKPDLLIMIIGANDRRNSTVNEAYLSMVQILEKIECEVIVLSTPHSSLTDPDNGNRYVPDKKITKPLMDNIYKIVKDRNITFIDLFKLFTGIESYIWRYDNVHFTIKGNELLFNEIVSNFLEGTK